MNVTPKIGSNHWKGSSPTKKDQPDLKSSSPKEPILSDWRDQLSCICDEYYCTSCNIRKKRGMYSDALRKGEISEAEIKKMKKCFL